MSSIVFFIVIVVLSPVDTRPPRGVSLPLSQASVKRLHQLALLKSRILSGLKLQYPPNVNNFTTKPEISTLVFTQLHYGSTLVAKNSGKDNMAVILSEPTDDVHTLQFKMDDHDHKAWKKVRSAHLLIHIRAHKHVKTRKLKGKRKGRRMKIRVHGYHPKRKQMKRLVVRKIRLRREKWLNMRLPLRLLRKMSRTSNKTVYLKITCKGCEKWANIDMAYKYGFVNGTHNKRNQMLNLFRPYIIFQNKKSPDRLKRKQRSVSLLNSDTTCLTEVTSCCTQPMNVTFAEIGWDDWVVYPRSFETGICFGHCDRIVMPRHCRPTQRSALTIVYYKSQNTIVRQTLPNIIDSGCACKR